MTLYRGRSWYCDGCAKWHPLARYVEGESPSGGSWCSASIKRALRDGRNVNLPGYLLDSFRREMKLA